MKEELTFAELLTIAEALKERKRNYIEFLKDIQITTKDAELESIILNEINDINNACKKINKEIWGD